MRKKKLLEKILSGAKNIKFEEFVTLINAFGFKLDRQSGSHSIYKKENIEELINIQNYKGNVKPYQIKQFLSLIEKYNFNLEEK
jgi:predicted RNA binding protein YcfA (HicA-like mRNA interferase family)